MRPCTITVARAMAAGAAALGISACGSGSNSSTGPKGVPPVAVQQELAANLANSIAAQIQAMRSTGATPFLVLFSAASAHDAPVLMQRLGTNAHPAVHFLAFTENCPEITPTPITDSDEDGVPDDVTETYTTDNCTDNSSGMLSLSGSFEISDPTASTADLDYDSNIGHFVLHASGTSGSQRFDLSLGLGGTLDIAETVGAITENDHYYLTVNETAPQQVKDSVNANLTATYTFPAETLLVEGQPLPAGTFSANGTESFTRGKATYSFSLETTTPLSVDPNCVSGVTVGEVTLTFGNSGSVHITWTSCGVYSVSQA
jgi:hypothetical protein